MPQQYPHLSLQRFWFCFSTSLWKMTTQLISPWFILTIWRFNFHFALSSTMWLSHTPILLLLLSQHLQDPACVSYRQVSYSDPHYIPPSALVNPVPWLAKRFPSFHAKHSCNSHLPHLSIWSCQVTPSLKPSTSITSNLSFLSSLSKL